MSFRFMFPLMIVGALAACQTAMSTQEARQVTARFAGSAFVPPPRTVTDILALLDQQKLDNPDVITRARARAEQPPPASTDPATLATFYYGRALAAAELGRTQQEIEDLRKAAEFGLHRRLDRLPNPVADQAVRIIQDLALAELFGGSRAQALKTIETAISALRATPGVDEPLREGGKGWLRSWFVPLNIIKSRTASPAGDFTTAEAALAEAQRYYNELAREPWVRPESGWEHNIAAARARLAEARGRLAEAEALWRESLATAPPPTGRASLDWRPFVARSALARVIAWQGRLVEAEHEARAALVGSLRRFGRNSFRTANVLRSLVTVIAGQGRYAEAETLARAVLDIYHSVGASPGSHQVALTRNALAAALGAQRRYPDAVAEYEQIRVALGDEPEAFERYFAGNLDWAIALIHTGGGEHAQRLLAEALERSRRAVGDAHPWTAEVRGLLAIEAAVRGDRAGALRAFTAAVPVLLASPFDLEDERTSRPARDDRIQRIVAAYIGLLADIRGTSLERDNRIDAAAEAFRLADAARDRVVQRALDATAARATAATPALAELARAEQDTGKRIAALNGILANLLGVSADRQDARVVTALRTELEALHRERAGLRERLRREFPAYTRLLTPSLPTLEEARASLAPGESLIVTFVAADRTFVWAVPHAGPVAFTSVSLGERAVEAAVARLRAALDPKARVLGDIPAFEVEAAHHLYRALLEPVAAGWREAGTLLVVAHGALGQLPFGVLPTTPAPLAPTEDVLFASYRAVPWLARTHAVAALPSVSALITLRTVPAGAPERRPFIGFGDPYFNAEQARAAASPPAGGEVAARDARSHLLTRRDLTIQPTASSRLGILPRLSDTAEELRAIATTLGADPARDVFVGREANERAVKTLDLSRYRVLAFATHGLLPGDLDGLTQPALALTAPEVAGVEGDGLLTMEEILALRLDAEWVVLSACNTASGQGAGAEAVSGLGRAFFYAGARALLVSNWPVETTSARALTTTLFRAQSENPALPRVRALQYAMHALIDGPGVVDPLTRRAIFSYAHPIFWASFSLVGDPGGRDVPDPRPR